jgi:L-aspartate oxidase
LASNSMLEVLVFSKRIIEKSLQTSSKNKPESGNQEIRTSLPDRKTETKKSPVNLRSLQDLMWNKAGIIRNKEGLTLASDTLAWWQKCLPEPTDRSTYELSNLVLTGRLLAEAALIREESRGAHFRSDFPAHSKDWEKHIIFNRC